ncbi:hypothetical protein AB0J13_10905 [Streptomyces anulatus]|uniref:hypothetical protein n=1 Tax=Streptomyces anulatus TaxID=1892 RepID=UPI0033F6C1C3
MTARAAVLAYLQQAGLSTLHASARIDQLLQEHAHELGERLRNIHTSGEGAAWNWWDAAVVPGECANLIDPPTKTTSGTEAQPEGPEVPCTLRLVSRGHAAHTWQTHPGLPLVRCPGSRVTPAAPEATP